MKTFIITLMLSLAAGMAGGGTRLQATETGFATGEEASEEFKREITREFNVGADPDLRIDNRYGRIRISEGAEGKILFRIEITGKGRNASLAREYAEAVAVDFTQSGNSVSATTQLKSITCNNCGRTIHYTVVVPRSVKMNLVNKYGNIELENAVKPLNVELKYGNITATSLTDAIVDIKYGNIDFRSCERGHIDIRYGNLKIGTAEKLVIDSKYDKIQIGTVAALNLETGYTGVKIDRVSESCVTNIKYGSLDIAEVAPAFRQIKVDAGYTNVRIALDSRHSFRASLTTRYGNIDTGSLKFNDVSLRNKSSVTGVTGSSANPSATVEIDASYGNINLK
jgi:hypothetical protein